MAHIPSVWPNRVDRHLPVDKSQILIVLSRELVFIIKLMCLSVVSNTVKCINPSVVNTNQEKYLAKQSRFDANQAVHADEEVSRLLIPEQAPNALQKF